VGAAAALASAAVVVAVVIVIGALGPGHTPSAVGSDLPAGLPRTARSLVARIAVLRRPQTAADRLPAPALMQARKLDPSLVPSLTRFATTVDAGSGPLAAIRAYVTLSTANVPTGSFASVGVALVSSTPSARLLALSGGMAPGAGALFSQPSDVLTVVVGRRSVRTSLWLAVLRDGVASARWVFTPFPAGTGPDVTVFPRIENNVAIAPGAPAGGNLVSATWYATNGRVLSSFSDAARIKRLQAAQASRLSRSAHEPIPAALSQHFSVFRDPPPPAATIELLPAYARGSLAANPEALNIDQARFVRYPGTPGFWVIPGHYGAAMATLAGTPGLGSGGVPLRGRASILDDHMITTIGSAPPHETVYGLVPDGNPTVTIELADGATKTVPVIDNVYAVTLATRPRALIAKNANGQRVNVRVPG
jgi:hypothetical protein